MESENGLTSVATRIILFIGWEEAKDI